MECWIADVAKLNNNKWSGVAMKSIHLTQVMRKINEIQNVLFTSNATGTLQRTYPTTPSIIAQGCALYNNAALFVARGSVVSGVSTIYAINIATETVSFTFTVNKLPRQLYVDNAAGELYVIGDPDFGATPKNEVVTVHSVVDGSLIRSFGGTADGTGDGQFNGVNAGQAVVYGGEVYICDGNNRVQVFTPAGAYVRKWGSYGTSNGQFNGNYGIEEIGGEIYVSDYLNKRVQVFQTDGTFVRKFATGSDYPFTLLEVNGALLVNMLVVRVINAYSTSGTLLGTLPDAGAGYVWYAMAWDSALEELHVTKYDSTSPVTDIVDFVSVFTLSLDTAGTGEQTEWTHKTKRGVTVSMGTPDGGVNVPATDAIRNGVPLAEIPDDRMYDLADNYLIQIRNALTAIVHEGTLLNPKTGVAYNLTDGDAVNNVYYVAMNPFMADYGLVGQTLYSWARPLTENETTYYDVDVGEVWRVTEVLYDAARIQGLL